VLPGAPRRRSLCRSHRRGAPCCHERSKSTHCSAELGRTGGHRRGCAERLLGGVPPDDLATASQLHDSTLLVHRAAQWAGRSPVVPASTALWHTCEADCRVACVLPLHRWLLLSASAQQILSAASARQPHHPICIWMEAFAAAGAASAEAPRAAIQGLVARGDAHSNCYWAVAS
jgi:hypothetical protein